MNRLYYLMTHALLSVSSFLCHVQQAELARMNEDLELFNNDTNPHYFFMKVVRVNIFSDFYCDISYSFEL
jgi:hypothetical protein